jgi:hypothetical protein
MNLFALLSIVSLATSCSVTNNVEHKSKLVEAVADTQICTNVTSLRRYAQHIFIVFTHIYL